MGHHDHLSDVADEFDIKFLPSRLHFHALHEAPENTHRFLMQRWILQRHVEFVNLTAVQLGHIWV
jgi:hypothetical protein